MNKCRAEMIWGITGNDGSIWVLSRTTPILLDGYDALRLERLVVCSKDEWTPRPKSARKKKTKAPTI